MLKIENVSYSYEKTILKNCSLNIEEGKIVGLVAPNGTGKTTLLKLIAKDLPLTEGRIELNGISICNRESYLKQIFFVENSDSLYGNLTVVEHLQYTKDFWESSISIDKIIDTLRMKEYMNFKLKKLSLGMKQQVIIGMQLISDSQLLIMDEPYNGLDPSNIAQVKKCFEKLKEKGKTILFSSHDLYNMTGFCDEVLFLKEQQVALRVSGEEDLIDVYNKVYSVGSGGVLI
ncbi:ABC transporter ATP-binding protein [Enterococcus sp. LJL120]